MPPRDFFSNPFALAKPGTPMATLSREDRVALIGRAARALADGRLPDDQAREFVGNGLLAWLSRGGNLTRDHWRTSGQQGSTHTESVLWKLLMRDHVQTMQVFFSKSDKTETIDENLNSKIERNNCMTTLAKIINRGIWRDGFGGDKPERFIAGVCVSTAERIKDVALLPDGLVSEDEDILPLFLDHQELLPVGACVALTAIDDQVHFLAHLGQGFACADDIWKAIVARELSRVSITFEPVGAKPVDGVYRQWRATEISLVDVGADDGAKILRCWEVHPGTREQKIFWNEVV
jgi:hypothetical protein